MSSADFVTTRQLSNGRERVWRAWTHPDEIAAWAHPQGYRTPWSTVDIDLRPGGAFSYAIVDPDTGDAFLATGRYLAVDAPHEFSATWAFGAADAVPSTDDPAVTVTLDETSPTSTLMTFRLAGPSAADRVVREGWDNALDVLARHVDTTDDARGFALVRTLDAPVEKVWAAWTEPDAMGRWMHDLGVARESITADPRPGGDYCYTMSDEVSGATIVTGGRYLVVDEPHTLEFTWGDPELPDAMLPRIRVALVDTDRGIEMTFRLRGFLGEPGDGYVFDGWAQTLALIAESVEAG